MTEIKKDATKTSPKEAKKVVPEVDTTGVPEAPAEAPAETPAETPAEDALALLEADDIELEALKEAESLEEDVLDPDPEDSQGDTEAMSPEEKLQARRDASKTLTIQDQIAMRRMSSYSTKIPTALAIRRRKAGMR